MIERIKVLGILTAIGIVTTGCASIISGGKQDIAITSSPSNAQVFVNDKLVGRTPYHGTFRRTSPAKRIEVDLKGYKAFNTEIKKKWNPVTLVNILTVLWAPIGLTVDKYFTGAYYKFDPDKVPANLKPKQDKGK
jgi:hypothetical protein